MTPRFSATKTRPSDANLTVGCVSPLNTADSWKPGGEVAARAGGAVDHQAVSDASTSAAESVADGNRPGGGHGGGW